MSPTTIELEVDATPDGWTGVASDCELCGVAVAAAIRAVPHVVRVVASREHLRLVLGSVPQDCSLAIINDRARVARAAVESAVDDARSMRQTVADLTEDEPVDEMVERVRARTKLPADRHARLFDESLILQTTRRAIIDSMRAGVGLPPDDNALALAAGPERGRSKPAVIATELTEHADAGAALARKRFEQQLLPLGVTRDYVRGVEGQSTTYTLHGATLVQFHENPRIGFFGVEVDGETFAAGNTKGRADACNALLAFERKALRWPPFSGSAMTSVHLRNALGLIRRHVTEYRASHEVQPGQMFDIRIQGPVRGR